MLEGKYLLLVCIGSFPAGRSSHEEIPRLPAFSREGRAQEYRCSGSAMLQILGNVDRRYWPHKLPKPSCPSLWSLRLSHTTALKAQEAFYEKYKDTRVQDGVDYDEIRDDIWRHLDCIRAAIQSKGISKEPE